MESKLIVFNDKQIRRILHKNEWWFSISDVCGALTDSPDPGAYWRKLKQRLKAEGSEVVTFCHDLKLPAPDGKMRLTDCANTEGIFRIIQSIPSPKAEPFKRWLAKVGYERVQEIEDPELATKRTREIYHAKGYSDAWIEKADARYCCTRRAHQGVEEPGHSQRTGVRHSDFRDQQGGFRHDPQ